MDRLLVLEKTTPFILFKMAEIAASGMFSSSRVFLRYNLKAVSKQVQRSFLPTRNEKDKSVRAFVNKRDFAFVKGYRLQYQSFQIDEGSGRIGGFLILNSDCALFVQRRIIIGLLSYYRLDFGSQDGRRAFCLSLAALPT